MKRRIFLLLALTCLLLAAGCGKDDDVTQSGSASGSGTAISSAETEVPLTTTDKIFRVLRTVYMDAEGFSVDRNALENAFLGDPISAYELVDSKIQKISAVYYPVISGRQILLFVMESNGVVSAAVDATGDFTGWLSEFLDSGEKIALLHDSTGCYAVTVDRAVKLKLVSSTGAGRGTFTGTAQVMEYVSGASLEFTAVAPKTPVREQLTAP